MPILAKDLREAVLQAAIQGRLTSQISSDNSIRDLLKIIILKREVLIKNNVIKNEKLSPIIDDETPFEIPSSWMWVRLNDVVSKEIRRGKSPKYATEGKALAFAQKCNSKYEGIRLDLAKYLDDNSLERYSVIDNMVDLDIIINSTGGGTMGRVGLYESKYNVENRQIFADSHVTVIRCLEPIVNRYIYICLKYFQPYLESLGEGSTNQTELKPLVIKNLLIPLPPIEEQQRIVDKVNELMQKIDEYEKIENQLIQLKKEFPGNMRDAILQAAMQGKLTEQLSTDSSVDKLLQFIKMEKAQLVKEKKMKKEKTLPLIDENEIPFDIPNNWKWERIGNVFNVVMGQSPKGEDVHKCKDDELEFHQGKICFTDRIIGKSDVSCASPKKIAMKNSLLLCVRAPIGDININDRDIGIGRGLCSITTNCDMTLDFSIILFRWLKEEFVRQGTGSTFKAITMDVVLNQIFPLPPIEEQNRIVDITNKLLSCCKSL